MALIAQGLSNQAIADRAFRSINSVKTCVRTAYRKIGVSSRSQAVIWAMANGFTPDTLRTVDASLIRRRPQFVVSRAVRRRGRRSQRSGPRTTSGASSRVMT